MKTMLILLLLFANNQWKTNMTNIDNGYLYEFANQKDVDSIIYDFTSQEPDTIKKTEIPDFIYKTLCINTYLPMICDTVLCPIGLWGGVTSSYIVYERRGVGSARKFESFFRYISPKATITKGGRYYALSSDDMKQIYNLYVAWWQKILTCDNVQDLEKLLSSHPLEGSIYEWRNASSHITNFKETQHPLQRSSFQQFQLSTPNFQIKSPRWLSPSKSR